jgi:hypothetical protein
MSLLGTLTGRKKREKFVPPVPLIPDTLPLTQAVETAKPTEVYMATPTKNPFIYIKGTGKEDKAEYRFGAVTVPAAVITRVMKEVQGMPEKKQGYLFYTKLVGKYSAFIEALDAAKIEYTEALSMLEEVKPPKYVGTGARGSSVSITAEMMAKGICRRFKGTPEEMVTQFLKVVTDPEFKKEAVDIIKAYQKNFGISSTGHTKTSNRKGNPAAIKALKLARDKKAKK